MKKFLLSMLALALLAAPCSRAVAAEQAKMEPIVVVSLASYDELFRDLDYLGKSTDNPGLAKGIEGGIAMFTQWQGLVGLDTKRPIGAAVTTDGNQYQMLVFIPVTDLKKLAGALQGLIGEPEDAGDGVLRFATRNMPIYVKEHDGWAFVAQSPDSLADLPKDPIKLLGGLEKQYDVGVRLNVQNIPEVFRQMAMDQIKMGVQAGMEQQQIDDPAQAEMRAKLVQRQMDELATAINEIDQLTVGAEIDSEGHRALLDLGVTALADSKTAKQMASGPKEASKFLGFLLPDSVVRMHLNSSMPEDDAQNLAGMFDSFKKQVNDSIDNSDDLDDDKEKAKVKKLANEALDIVAASLKKGIFNGGLSLTGTGPFTLAGGVYLDGAPKMEGVFKQTVEMFKDEDDAPEVKLDADEYQGVKFHKLSFDLDDDEEDDKDAKKDAKKAADADDDDDDNNEAIAEFFGDPLELTLGFGPQSFYFALGKEGVSTLKRVIDRSADGKPAPSAPEIEATLALAPLLKFAAEQKEENAMLGLVADGLKQGGKDHVLLTAVPVANGARYRLEAEEGVLKLLSALGKLAAAQQQRVPAAN